MTVEYTKFPEMALTSKVPRNQIPTKTPKLSTSPKVPKLLNTLKVPKNSPSTKLPKWTISKVPLNSPTRLTTVLKVDGAPVALGHCVHGFRPCSYPEPCSSGTDYTVSHRALLSYLKEPTLLSYSGQSNLHERSQRNRLGIHNAL